MPAQRRLLTLLLIMLLKDGADTINISRKGNCEISNLFWILQSNAYWTFGLSSIC